LPVGRLEGRWVAAAGGWPVELSVSVGVIQRKRVLTHASIVCDMLASVNSVSKQTCRTNRFSQPQL